MPPNKRNLHDLICLDIVLLASGEELAGTLTALPPYIPRKLGLISLDISAPGLLPNKKEALKRSDLATLSRFSRHSHWAFDLQQVLAFSYTALVLTNQSQQIQWVNPGFTAMSGYSRKEAIGKKPSFLQGPKTCPQIRKIIAGHLTKGLPVCQKVINYRKNGELYFCQINILPVVNTAGKLTHFLALEREVSQ